MSPLLPPSCAVGLRMLAEPKRAGPPDTPEQGELGDHPDKVQLLRDADTSIEIVGVSRGDPAVVATKVEHCFKNGQIVIVSGVSGAQSGSATGQSEWKSLCNGEHTVSHAKPKSFALLGVNTSALESCARTSGATVAASIMPWTSRRPPLPHEALFCLARVSKKAAMPALSLARCICTVMESTPADQAHPAVAFLAKQLPSFPWLSQLCDAITRHKLEGPSPVGVWQRWVESTQPAWWGNSTEAVVCAECQAPFGDGEAHGEKHHCRQCGRVVCTACSQTRQPVPWHGYSGEEAVCDLCKDLVKQRHATLRAHEHLLATLDVPAKVRSAGKGAGKGKASGKGKPPGAPPPPRPPPAKRPATASGIACV